MKARIFGALFVLIVLVMVYGFTQDAFSVSGRESNPAEIQSSPAPTALDNEMKSLKIN